VVACGLHTAHLRTIDKPDGQDFTGRDATRPRMFARVYRQVARADASRQRYRTIAAEAQLGSGQVETERAAARAAEKAYAEWLAAL
jgi:hypothetical protein